MFEFLKKKIQPTKQKKEDVTSFVPQELMERQSLEIKDIVAPSAVKITSKELELGQRFAKTFFIISYPRYLNKEWFSPLVNLGIEFDVSIFINPIDSTEALRKFRKKVAQVESQINTRASKGLVRDPKLDVAYADLEELRDKLQQTIEKLFDIGIYITVYGNDQDDLKRAEKELKSVLETKLIFVKPALFQQEEGFKTIVPIGKDYLEVYSKLTSEPLSSIFPFVSFNLSSERGILFGVNRHNSSLVLFDRFSLPNYNSVCFATSGAGKSYALKLEAIRSLMIGIDVMVIDPEKEFGELAKAVDGRYFNISLNSEHHINPFDLPEVGEDEDSADVLRSSIISLGGFFRVLFGDLTQEEDALLDKAITETYALKDITPESDFKNTTPPLLSDLEIVLNSMEGAENLSKKLLKYTKGSWSNFINNPTNIDINKRLVVFSIRDMEETLRPAAMYIITRFIWNSVRKKLKKRLLIVDEAWIMMRHEDSASFLFGMVKRGRKYFLGVATITQDVSDFLRSEHGLSIITNSSIKLLLRQSDATINSIQEAFNLTQEEKFLLLQAAVGEGVFIAGLKRVAIKIVASFVEDKIITSDPAQLLSRKANE